MKAIKIHSIGRATVVTDAKIPSLRPDYILVNVSAVALNPTDWKHIDMVNESVTIGCDYAGTVEEVGPAVTKPWNKGDRICGMVHGSNLVHPEDGAFGEYLVAKGDVQIRIPKGMSFAAAATLGVGVVTAGQGLYQSLGLPLPDSPAKEKFPVLIYGGSSAMGAFGIQFAKCSGLQVITTCSERNFDYVKSLGADAVFDYKSPTCGADIRKLTNNQLFYAWDTIGEASSPQICAEALSSQSVSPSGKKPQYGNIVQARCPRDDVESKGTLAYTAFGEDFVMGRMHVPARPGDFEFMKNFVDIAQVLLNSGRVKPHRPDVRPEGLDGILSGLQEMKDGKVSAKKLVYQVHN